MGEMGGSEFRGLQHLEISYAYRIRVNDDTVFRSHRDDSKGSG